MTPGVPCPLLAYRDEDDDHDFDTARAYCTAIGEFVEPMRADICNNRYNLHHEDHCEIFQAHIDED